MGKRLTAQHERFALEVARGKSYTDAAIAAGYSPHSAGSAGSRMARRPDIAKRIETLTDQHRDQRAKALAKVDMPTRERVLQGLLDVLNAAREDNNLQAQLRALELLGKELGMFVQRFEGRVESPLAGLAPQQLAVLSQLLAMPLIEGEAAEIRLEGT